MRIALDAMGGDFAPRETVLGALQAAEARPDHEIALVGDAAAIEAQFKAAGQSIPSNILIVHASQAVAMDEKPVEAIKKKRDNSIVRAVKWSPPARRASRSARATPARWSPPRSSA